MSFLKLCKRLQPAKKAWKIFTSKLHSKLHKFNRSKAIKKSRNRLRTPSKAVPWPALIFQPRHQRKRRTIQTTQKILHCYRLQKRSAPVYIDKLFIGPASPLKEHLQPPGTVATSKGLITEKCSTSSETAKLPDQPADDFPGTSEGAVEGQEEMRAGAADDMWESLGLASPQMHGINERADEFITRIRAEMQLQEMMARRL